jgi:hypothetical protein
MRFSLKIDDLTAGLSQAEVDAARSITAGMRDVADGLKGDLRADVVDSGLGQRLANTWRARTYPEAGFSMEAAAFVWSKAPKIIDAFDRGVTIRSRDGFWLAIPTGAAGAKGLDQHGTIKRITPGSWERRTGMRLRFVYRRNAPSLLVADNARLTKSGLARANTRRNRGGATYTRLAGRSTVVIFILVPQVTLKKRFDIGRTAAQWAARVPSAIATRWK